MDPTAAPELAVFRKAVDTTFRLHLDDTSTVELTLVEVLVFDRHPGWESFSLLFTGPHPAFAQASYLVEHGSAASFDLFLVPVRSPGDEQRYEAVFNRPVA